jgi:psp operon transcriptional activator
MPVSEPTVALSVSPVETCDLKAELAQLEQRLIQRALQQQHFNQRRTAQALGLTYDQLRAALRKYPQLLTERNSTNK